jgi:uncharacterized protein
VEELLIPADVQGRTRLLILQGSPFCNIDCEYCYLASRNDRQRMHHDLVECAISWVYRNGLAGDDLTIVWHAGEPLVLPPQWYDEAFARAKRAAPQGARIRQAIQTNGMLIDDAWCDLFLSHQVSVGVSLDGPASMHDSQRRTRSGKGTHSQVMSGIATLKRRRVPFHVIAVITEQTLAEPDAFVDFFLGNDLCELGINIEEIEGENRKSTLGQLGIERRFRAFFDHLVDRANASGRLSIREFWHAYGAILEPISLDGNEENTPFAIISVSADGRIFTFSPELLGQIDSVFGDFSIGRIDNTELADVLNEPRFKKLHSQIVVGIEACRRSCAYFSVCGGGAPANKLGELGDLGGTETLFCRLVKQEVTEAVLARLDFVLSQQRRSKLSPTAQAGSLG